MMMLDDASLSMQGLASGQPSHLSTAFPVFYIAFLYPLVLSPPWLTIPPTPIYPLDELEIDNFPGYWGGAVRLPLPLPLQ
jgi:hypothetical protein